jgi:hypothetical protein
MLAWENPYQEHLANGLEKASFQVHFFRSSNYFHQPLENSESSLL